MQKASPSMDFLRPYSTRNADGSIDATGIFSRECYLAWMQAKGIPMENKEGAKKFLRMVCNHVSASVSPISLFRLPDYTSNNHTYMYIQEGRCPFDEDVEPAVLEILRRKKPWPCFPAELSHFGQRFRARGYHERLREEKQQKQLLLHPLDLIVHFPQARQQSIEENMQRLAPNQARFVRTRCEAIFNSLVTNFDLREREDVLEVMRYTFLGNTARCSTITPAQAAHTLLQRFEASDTNAKEIISVWDLTSPSYATRVVAQNARSLKALGDMQVDSQYRIIKLYDLQRLLLAVVASYLKPGVAFTMPRQEMLIGEKLESMHYDIEYIVDPTTFLAVMHGKPSAM